MATYLDFEQKIKNLQDDIESAIISGDNDAISILEKELEKEVSSVYSNISDYQKLQLARHPDRPYAMDYIESILKNPDEINGDRHFKDDKAIVCGLARIGNQNVTVIAEQKGRTTKENIERNFGMPNPESYRKAIRLMKQAEKFNRPIVTFIDTKGAYPGIEAEQRGQGEAIAKSMMEMAILKTPIICIVIGEGSSGGALAIGVGDEIIMLENAVYSVLSPEGFSSILWKDGKRVKEAAEKMKMTAQDLKKLKVVDKIIDEPEGGAQKDLEGVAENMKKTILSATKKLAKKSKDELVQDRYQKFRKMGEYTQ